VSGYFITGTDTNVGKTFVASMLARRAQTKQCRVFAFKPIETGCVDALGSDQKMLVESAGSWQEGALKGAVQLRRSVAPFVAARDEGRSIDVATLIMWAHSGTQLADLTIVEGAGGWRVPITDEIDMAAFAKQIGLPVLLVARAGLGTINHSLLSLEAIARDGCRVAALVMSRRPDDDRKLAIENLEEIARRWGGSCLLLEDDPSVLDPLISF
jgi:dethiobiotin synthetase